jgi:hypothetical protein
MKRCAGWNCLVIATICAALGSVASAQKEIRADGSASPATVPERVSPAQAVVFEVNRPWLTAADWDSNTPPAAFGMQTIHEPGDAPAGHPRFSVVDANAKSLWVYRAGTPVDLQKYPILSIRYEAWNTNPNASYVLRLVHGTGGEDKTLMHVFKGSELVADGQQHELAKDLRELNAANSLLVIGVGLSSNEQGNASFDLLDLRLSAPPDAPNDAPPNEQAIPFLVVDLAGAPVRQARLTLDAERRNFARSARSRDDGTARVRPVGNESGKHMLRVEGEMLVPVELSGLEAPTDPSEPLKIVMQPASFYGGILHDDDGKAIPNATIMLRPVAQKQVDRVNLGLDQNVITDSRGRWTSPALPTDKEMFSIAISRRNAGGATEVRDTLPQEVRLAATTLDDLRKQISDADGGVAYAPASEMKPRAQAIAAASAPASAPALEVSRGKATSRPVTIQTADDTSITGGLVNLHDDQLTVAIKSNEQKTIPLRDVLEMTFQPSSTTTPAPKPTTGPVNLKDARVQLANGDRLNASVLGWADQRVVVQPAVNPSAKLQLPVNQLAELWCGTSDQVKKAAALKEQAGLEDIAFAAKEDQVLAVHGVAAGIDGDSLSFRFGGQDRKIALNRLVGVIFARQDLLTESALEQIIALPADQTISGAIVSMDASNVTLRSRWGDTIPLPLDLVSKITCRNGRVVYLSDLKPASVEQVPYFDRMLTYRADQSLDGKSLVLSDGTYRHGIAVHSRCVLGYDLGGKYDEFRCKVGFQQPEGKLGEAVVRVLGDGKMLFEKSDARGDHPPFEISAKLVGVQRLTLEVDFGKGQDVGDRVIWANARVLRAATAAGNN